MLLKKQQLGRTNLMVSRLCYGTLAIGPYHSNLSPEKGSDLLVKAYENGVNFWDTAEMYSVEPHLQLALEKLNYPEDLVIASRSYARTYKEMATSIKQALDSLKINTIPVFGLHELDGKEDFMQSGGAFKALQEFKEKGFIQAIAVTMHSVESVKLVSELAYVDVVFPLYNMHGIGIKDGSVKDMTQAIESAANQGKGVYAMKVLGGGHLVESAEECFEFALQNQNLDAIAVGMDNDAEIMMNIEFFSGNFDKAKNYKNKISLAKRTISIDPWCEGCAECIQACPNDALTLEFSQAKVDPDKCVLCGYCASVCPYFCIKVVKKESET